MSVPTFKRIGPGTYDTADGRFTLYQLQGVYPPAWNVDLTTDWAYEHPAYVAEHGETIVDGAASKRDALALFADEYPTLTLP